jgi:hypothetical protein
MADGTQVQIDRRYIGHGPIVGCTWNADNICVRCVRVAVEAELGTELHNILTALRAYAHRKNVNLADETSYDSGDFPKPFTRGMADPGDRCGSCGKRI